MNLRRTMIGSSSGILFLRAYEAIAALFYHPSISDGVTMVTCQPASAVSSWKYTLVETASDLSSLTPCRGAAGPEPDLVPVFHVPGCVPAKGVRHGATAVGAVQRLHTWVLFRLQGQLAPGPRLPRERSHHHVSARREQVLLPVKDFF